MPFTDWFPILLAAVNLLATIVAVGMAYARLREHIEAMDLRIEHMEMKLGNGTPGVFARSKEIDLLHQAIDRRLDRLEKISEERNDPQGGE